MSKDVLFKSKISQAINIIPIATTLILTILFFIFKQDVFMIIMNLLVAVDGVITLPAFDAETLITVVLYLTLSIPWLFSMWRILVVHNTIYEFTNDRILIEKGVLNKENDFLEYYRIKDYSIKRPLLARMFNLCDMSIISTDRTDPLLNINMVDNLLEHEGLIRNKIEESTAQGKGREIDVV